MRRLPSWTRSAPVAAAIALGMSAWPAQAQNAAAKPETALAGTVAACERAAQQTLGTQAPRPVEVTFSGTPTVQPAAASDGQTVLHGAGRARGPAGVRTFTYICNVDRSTSEAVGLVMRDTTPAAPQTAAPRAAAEPDISRLSPAACESSAVQALQERWPQVAKITFDSATRSFRQQSANSAELHGTGRAQPAPELPAAIFGFDCTIDPRDGRVLRTRVSG